MTMIKSNSAISSLSSLSSVIVLFWRALRLACDIFGRVGGWSIVYDGVCKLFELGVSLGLLNCSSYFMASDGCREENKHDPTKCCDENCLDQNRLAVRKNANHYKREAKSSVIDMGIVRTPTRIIALYSWYL